jgi:hypothetical protein
MEATQSGADINSAAEAISGLLDAGDSQPSDDTRKQNQGEPAHESEAEQETPVQAEPETESQEQQTSSEDGEQADADHITLPESIDQLAEHLGVEPDALMGIKIKAKVDGKESLVNLSDVIKSYQLESHLNNKSMQLAEQRKAAETEIAQQKNLWLSHIEQANNLINHASNELTREYQSINWDELRAVDPAEWVAKRQEFTDRANAIQNSHAQLSYGLDQQIKAERDVQGKQFQSFLQQEKNNLLNKIPEWTNPEKAKAESNDLRSFLMTNGFSDDEVKGIADHRAILISRKAMLYDKLMATKPQVDKKVVNLPKVMKAGTTKTKADVQAEKMRQKIANVRKSGRVEDAASAIFDMLK